MLSRTLFAILALVATAAAAASVSQNITTLEGRSLDKRYICETSNGSPSTADARAAARHIAGLAKLCCVTNGGGSHCNTLYKTGSAAVGICGPYSADQSHACVSCASAGDTLYSLANNCDSNGKSGGQSPVGNYLRVILFHS